MDGRDRGRRHLGPLREHDRGHRIGPAGPHGAMSAVSARFTLGDRVTEPQGRSRADSHRVTAWPRLPARFTLGDRLASSVPAIIVPRSWDVNLARFEGWPSIRVY